MRFIANEDTLQGLVFWTMGSLAQASWEKLAILSGAFAIILPLSMKSSWKLTTLRLGEDGAVSFGIDVRRLRFITLLRISIVPGCNYSCGDCDLAGGVPFFLSIILRSRGNI